MSRMPALGVVAALVAVSAIAIAATPVPTHRSIPPAVVAPRGVLPSIVHHAGREAVDAYRVALHSPAILQAVPCTCGCVESLGHDNNLDCYIDELYADGEVSYSTHGLYCYICQVITHDAVAGAAAGMRGDELQRMILDRYGPGR